MGSRSKARRRTLILLALAFSFAAASLSYGGAAAGTRANQKLKIQGVWVKGDTSLAGVWLAEKRGYFANSGLDVSVTPGGNLDPIQIVLAGSADVGIQSLPALLAARSKGAPLKIFACEFRKSPYSLIGRVDAGIKRFSDLRGKKIGTDAQDLLTVLAWLQANGISKNDVKIVITGFDLTPLLTKRVDAKLGYATNEGLILKDMHIPVTVMVAADNGFPLPDYCFFTTDKGFSKHSTEIKSFLAGARKGWLAARANPSAATDAVLALQSGAKRKVVLREIKLDISGFILNPAQKGPLFSVSPASIAKISSLLRKVGFIKKPVAPSEIYDGSLIPTSG